ncbi:MAG: hypothetical protein ACQEWW_20510 [Bacillota bacterium]
MKKTIVLISLVIYLVGCGNKFIRFNGESDNWKGEYSTNIDGTRENGEYTFSFKNAKNDTTFENLQIVINDDETRLIEDIHKGATVKISSSCSGCSVTSEDEIIKVNINWDVQNEETFFLELEK